MRSPTAHRKERTSDGIPSRDLFDDMTTYRYEYELLTDSFLKVAFCIPTFSVVTVSTEGTTHIGVVDGSVIIGWPELDVG